MRALESRAIAVNARPSIDLLRGLKREEIELILAAARARRVPAKSVMTYQGEPADSLLLLWKGRARYFFETPNGKKLILIWITPGHSFGGAALVPRGSNYLLSTETVRDSVVLVWDGPTIRGFARRFPQLMENAITSAVDYLSWYIAAHAALCSQTAGRGWLVFFSDVHPAWVKECQAALNSILPTRSWPMQRISLRIQRAVF